MSVRIVNAGIFVMLTVAGPAMAQPGPTQVEAPRAYAVLAPAATYTKRYGTTIALADVASIAVVVVGVGRWRTSGWPTSRVLGDRSSPAVLRPMRDASGFELIKGGGTWPGRCHIGGLT